MTTQEDLALLFSRNLCLDNDRYDPGPTRYSVEEQKPIIYSITQHYNHSAHVAREQSRHASEPPQTDQLTAEIILSRHGVEVASLSPSQIDLFRTADSGQQMRLVELWRICPPNYAGHAEVPGIGPWPSTSLQQEEAMAQMRYEREMHERRQSMTVDSDAMSDGSASTNIPLTPVQGSDGRWDQLAEPYMASGYELLAQREYEQSLAPVKDVYNHFGISNHAADPVYKSAPEPYHQAGFPVGGVWNQIVREKQVLQMEDQYGAYQDAQFILGRDDRGHDEDEEML